MKTPTCIFLFLHIALAAQLPQQKLTNTELDSHRNLNEINLGDSYQKWKNFLFDKEVHDKFVLSYTFKSDSCCNELFGNAAKLVKLTFQNDKVVSIRIELKSFFEGKKIVTSDEGNLAIETAVAKYETINKNFSNLFGKPYASHSNQENIPGEPEAIVQWRGANTFLETNYYYYKAVYPPRRIVGSAMGLTEKLEEARDKTVIVLSDLNFLKNKVKSGS